MKIKILTLSWPFIFASFCCTAQISDSFSGNQADQDSLARTSMLIRTAFSKGDVEAIMKYHHPDVIKALGYKNYQKGANAVKAGIAVTLQSYNLKFVENTVESLCTRPESRPPLLGSRSASLTCPV